MKSTLPTAGYSIFRICSVALLSICTLAACEKQPDSDSSEDIKITKITPPENSEQDNLSTEAEVTTPQTTESTDLTEPETQVTEVEVLSNDDLPPISQEAGGQQTEMIADDITKEAQITDVDYRSESGETLKVTFQTSAIDELQANVTLPSGKKILLTAPEGQGNNPTYRSTDGSIELVSHGGGGSVDLVQNGKVVNFNAISAEAEVVVQQ
ncbi:hypothetical protein [Psychrobacter sp. I-STPA6b]|uniref:hypothetical protein n=1 Tax=Psychrobacter sp. I-STPA6b TaxID=2585718 RepID=UPI001D0CBBBE|nr:hypothetical protein [Psychrobacter sp. I-STPA6b]